MQRMCTVKRAPCTLHSYGMVCIRICTKYLYIECREIRLTHFNFFFFLFNLWRSIYRHYSIQKCKNLQTEFFRLYFWSMNKSVTKQKQNRNLSPQKLNWISKSTMRRTRLCAYSLLTKLIQNIVALLIAVAAAAATAAVLLCLSFQNSLSLSLPFTLFLVSSVFIVRHTLARRYTCTIHKSMLHYYELSRTHTHLLNLLILSLLLWLPFKFLSFELTAFSCVRISVSPLSA